jgi:hypothetical protein
VILRSAVVALVLCAGATAFAQDSAARRPHQGDGGSYTAFEDDPVSIC